MAEAAGATVTWSRWRAGWRGIGIALLLLVGIGQVAAAQDAGVSTDTTAPAPRIGVLTIGPGSEYWSRFGHNAIVVDSGSGPALSYNYGYFDFNQPQFLLRFMRGRMLYIVARSTLEQELAQYAAEGRSVRLQWLQMASDQRRQAAEYLAWNALPENAEYRYDYFLANCSTRVRDVLDEALGGALRQQGGSRSRGLSYRSEALRLSAEVPWMMVGMHLLLGPRADQPLSRWEESFAPAHFADLLDLATTSNDVPLVSASIELLPQVVAPSAATAPRFWLSGLAVSVIVVVALAWLGSPARPRGQRWARRIAAFYWLLVGVLGVVMLALWFGTDHSMAGGNRNLLLFSPLSWLLLPALWLHRGMRLARLTWWLLLAGWVCAAALLFLSVRDQDNLEWLLISLPWLVLCRLQIAAPSADH